MSEVRDGPVTKVKRAPGRPINGAAAASAAVRIWLNAGDLQQDHEVGRKNGDEVFGSGAWADEDRAAGGDPGKGRAHAGACLRKDAGRWLSRPLHHHLYTFSLELSPNILRGGCHKCQSVLFHKPGDQCRGLFP